MSSGVCTNASTSMMSCSMLSTGASTPSKPERATRHAMTTEHVEAVQSSELVRKRLAKLMALRCFRNTKLEDLHAGIFPNSQSGDYSDVKVVSPYGEIPWQRLGRFSDDEMKVLMIDVVDRCYEFLSELLDRRCAAAIIERLKLRDPLPKWNDPRARLSGNRQGQCDD